MYYLSILIAITGLIVYQVAMHGAPRKVNPFSMIAWAYSIGVLIAILLSLVWSRFDRAIEPFLLTSKNLMAALTIGASALLIEAGFILVYRSGWSITIAPAIAQAAAISVVMVIGVLFFGDKLTLQRVLGLGLCIAGIFLVVRK